MDKSTKILLVVLTCALVVTLITTTALAVALCMDNSNCGGSCASGGNKNQKVPSGNGVPGLPPAGGNDNLDGGAAGRIGIVGQELEKVASALGMSTDELKSELKGGKTLAQIAGEKGVATQTITDAMLEPIKQRLSGLVEKGTLTQEQADQRLQQLKTRVEAFINNGGPLRRPGNGQNGQQAQPSATSTPTI